MNNICECLDALIVRQDVAKNLKAECHLKSANHLQPDDI